VGTRWFLKNEVKGLRHQRKIAQIEYQQALSETTFESFNWVLEKHDWID